MDHLPVFLSVRGAACLVAGGGGVAARKAEVLLKAGAVVRVVSPALGPALHALVAGGRVRWREGTFEASDLEGCRLVVAATDDQALNARIVRLAARQGRLANAVSGPERGDFILPAIIDRSPVLAAVSTGGTSPMLARFIRTRLETLIPAAFGRLAALGRELRAEVRDRIRPPAQRRAFWDQVFGGPIAEMVFAGREREARDALREALAQADPGPGSGEVFLVGAGPGDPDLLSLRAMRLLQQADVVVHDRLVSDEILDLVRRDAHRIYAGKYTDRHAMKQEEINRLLVRLAREGRRVLRLKGGDPFIFGRGGEEIAALAEEGIPFQVVPGITAATGCAAYAGIPLTHRDCAHACVFVTGHPKDGDGALDWTQLARPGQTLVVYMGLSALARICERLIAHGRPAATPIALVRQGTTTRQRVIEGTLGDLPKRVSAEELRPPGLLIIGEVVRLRGKLDWFRPTTPAPLHRTLGHDASEPRR